MGSGDNYDTTKQVISIIITEETLISDSPEYHHRFVMFDQKSGVEFSDLLEIHTLELSKLPIDTDGTEQIPLNYEGGISAFIEKEVLPYAPDAWVDESKTQIGYEISFTKHFYKPVKLRELSEIVADIRALESETAGLLAEVLGDG